MNAEPWVDHREKIYFGSQIQGLPYICMCNSVCDRKEVYVCICFTDIYGAPTKCKARCSTI